MTRYEPRPNRAGYVIHIHQLLPRTDNVADTKLRDMAQPDSSRIPNSSGQQGSDVLTFPPGLTARTVGHHESVT